MLRYQVDLRKKCKYFGIRNFKYFFSARNVKSFTTIKFSGYVILNISWEQFFIFLNQNPWMYIWFSIF